MFRRFVNVYSRESDTIPSYQFPCSVYMHEGIGNSSAKDRWYAMDDILSFGGNAAAVDASRALGNGTGQKEWRELVRQYNTTLQGLSYHVRDLQVQPTSKFVNAATVELATGLRFV